MNKDFKTFYDMLLANQKAFAAGTISSVAHADCRGTSLGSALYYLAYSLGCTLHGQLNIDSRGEFSLLSGPGQTFGEAFSSLLNRYSPRTGIQPGAILTPEATWCYLNHFSAEKMVLEFGQAQLKDSGP